ncbi:MAG: proteasome subunit beta [Cenarchaeum sp. SB0661_bin_35]|nr:proteasome subunit beta [Cenarchaeum sp. SB0667_bin_13]MXY37752.1 proteasome subunit beta [Cenarchaeum sp. SB0664_bin_35]MYB47127.1 proteasome subunit beta [Cenarchaeum sp. SB0662_bin_33]MYC80325.1 proteasome subunit beta [Cenarchaeum sp. SB0661_bin_35]MYI51248.1 proteasome subunit beta [Cenarchaeum sp. SB0673_bin_9]
MEVIQDKILHGTTTVGIRTSEGVVLCADMRASAGYFIANNNTMKIQRIDHHAGLTLAGGVADAQNIVDILRYHANLHHLTNDIPIPIKSLARLTSLLFHRNRGYPFIADILVGGFDGDGAALFNIDMFGSVEAKPFVTTGSGSPVAYGVLENEYADDLSMKDAKRVALHAVKAAIVRNIGTGDGINISVIDKDGFRLLAEEQKKAIINL